MEQEWYGRPVAPNDDEAPGGLLDLDLSSTTKMSSSSVSRLSSSSSWAFSSFSFLLPFKDLGLASEMLRALSGEGL